MDDTHYSQLVGGTIVDFTFFDDDQGSWPIFAVEKDGVRLQVEVSSDPEGNGPGHLFIGATP